MRNLKNFGITLAVSLVILGIVALFACGYVANTVCGIFNGSSRGLDEILSSGDTTAVDTSADDERFKRDVTGDSYTWLAVVADYRPDVFDNYYPSDASAVASMTDFGILGKEYRFVTAADIFLIRADVDTREYIVMTIPACTKAETPAGDYTLSEIYAYYGIDYLSQKIASMTGLPVNYYSVINSTDLASLANVVGSIKCTVPKEIYTDGKAYFTAPETTAAPAGETTAAPDTTAPPETVAGDTTEAVTTTASALGKGESALSAKLEPALLYSDLSDGIDDEMTILQSFAGGLMSNLADSSEKSLKSMFNGIKSKLVSTNITADAVSAEAEVIQGFSWFEVQTLTYPGRFVSAKGQSAAYYNPSIGDAVDFFTPYR